MSYFIETLKLSTKKINEEFEASKQVWHRASVGILREKIIKNILRPYLPDCYGITSGLCFDSEESKSRQMDILIYDTIYSYKLPFDEDFMVLPCESVYGTIEVKTELDSSSLKLAVDNIETFKVLKRKDATEFNFTPQCELKITGEELGTKKNDYFGVIFAFESSSVDSIMNNIKNLNCTDITTLPDIIVLLSQKTIIFKSNINQSGTCEICLRGFAEGYIPVFTGDDTIAYFVLYLLVILYHSKLKAIDLSKFFKSDFLKDKAQCAEIDKYICIRKEIVNGTD